MKPLYLLLLLAAVVASGCVRTAAKTTPDAPPLDMPAPPPREMEPNDAETPAPVPLVTEPARSTPQRPRPTTPREQPPRVEPPKPEPPKAEPPPAETVKPPEESPKPPSLQTTPATAEGEAERAVRASLSRASAALNRIDYRVLNADAKTQYDTAKRWIRQADEALRAKNLVFAKTAADKAAVLAAQLGGR
jgi:outer membrane biosynthesis protein TonB